MARPAHAGGRAAALPRVMAIWDPAVCGQSAAEAVAAVAAAGTGWLQLRDKRASDREFFERARQMRDAAVRAGVLLIVNDRVDVAAALGDVGVHLGQEDLPVEAARALLGADAPIGLSAGNDEELADAVRRPVDYVAVGPVFATGSKADAGRPVGLEFVRRACARTRLPVVAIGGVTAANAGRVFAAGAACVAAIGGVFGRPDPVAALRAIAAAAHRPAV